jgi:hypothetical protein
MTLDCARNPFLGMELLVPANKEDEDIICMASLFVVRSSLRKLKKGILLLEKTFTFTDGAIIWTVQNE